MRDASRLLRDSCSARYTLNTNAMREPTSESPGRRSVKKVYSRCDIVFINLKPKIERSEELVPMEKWLSKFRQSEFIDSVSYQPLLRDS